MSPHDSSLAAQLSATLPVNCEFQVHHISTPPTRCDPLYAAPPGCRSERTYLESHFVTLSTGPGHSTLLFAIEALVFTTRRLTTIFISKADSTGCLAGLSIPRGGGSIIRSVAAEITKWLVAHRRRPGTKLVVTLFARAQGQYLFPRSAENAGKHVLDDRGLVRWWCRTLDPVIRMDAGMGVDIGAWLVVPGFDGAETRGFFPPSAKEKASWNVGYPVLKMLGAADRPPRCLVPRLPDDPKARLLEDLDAELPDGSKNNNNNNATQSSPNKKGAGVWRSVKTLKQFWETMAFRQECSSGRLVGFLWIVFTPEQLDSQRTDDTESMFSISEAIGLASSEASQQSLGEMKINSSQDDRSARDPSRDGTRRALTGPIVPRAPRLKKVSSALLSHTYMQEETPYWRWPLDSRGQLVVDPATYTKIHDVLLRLDFSDDEAAEQSTSKWLDEAAIIAGHCRLWGEFIVGQKPAATVVTTAQTAQANDLSGMIRKKRKAGPPPDPSVTAPTTDESTVNTLAAGLVRKKPKTA